VVHIVTTGLFTGLNLSYKNMSVNGVQEMYRKIIAVCSLTHKKHKYEYTVRAERRNVNVRLVVHTATTELSRVKSLL
jgi:hypothetical protein